MCSIIPSPCRGMCCSAVRSREGGIASFVFAGRSLRLSTASRARDTLIWLKPSSIPPARRMNTRAWDSLFLTVAGEMSVMSRYSTHIHTSIGDIPRGSMPYLRQNVASSPTVALRAVRVPGACALSCLLSAWWASQLCSGSAEDGRMDVREDMGAWVY